MKVISNDIFFAQIESMLAEGESVVIRVKGFSMRPLMRSNRTQVRIAPLTDAEREKLRVNDIVLFRHHGRHILHRIRRIEDGKITLAGDGNYHLWEHCRREDILGIVTDVINFNGGATSCASLRWRALSALWLALPQLIRRLILSVLFRLGFK